MIDDRALIQPLGDSAVLVRFADDLSELANRRAITFARLLEGAPPEGVEEVVPGLVSVMLKTSRTTDFARLSGELQLRMGEADERSLPVEHWTIKVSFDGEDLPEVAQSLGLERDEFVARHNVAPLRVLATGFAPGFVYCGFHREEMVVPRREAIRLMVPAGTVLFAAGQTAIAATPIRTGWHVIGRTTFQNFDPSRSPPTVLRPGDEITFSGIP